MKGRRMIAAGVVAGAVTAGAVAGALIGIPGLSSASSGSTGSSTSTTTPKWGDKGSHHDARGFLGPQIGAKQDVFAAAAKALNLSTSDLLKKLSDGKTTIADVAQQQNVNVQDVISAMEAVANQDIQNLVNNPLPMPTGFSGGPGVGGRFGFGLALPGLRDATDQVAKALGITTDELRTDLRNGQSIADIAKSKNVDLSGIVDSLVSDAQSQLAQAVKDKKLTQAQADKLGTDLKQRITDLLNNTMPKIGPFGGFRMHGRGGFGPNGPKPGGPMSGGPESSATTSSAAI